MFTFVEIWKKLLETELNTKKKKDTLLGWLISISVINRLLLVSGKMGKLECCAITEGTCNNSTSFSLNLVIWMKNFTFDVVARKISKLQI